MDDIEIEVVDAPILKLFLADRLHTVVVMEGVPELGDEEEIGALDEAFFYGTGDALTGLLLVTVISKHQSQSYRPSMVPY